MAALSVVMIGIGVFCMYEAFENKTPHPLTKATQAVTTGIPKKG